MDRSFSREWQKAQQASRRESEDRRARVLAHPDLVQQLTEPPFALSDPQRWTGWIPPRAHPEDVCGHACGRSGNCSHTQHRARVNDSAVRRQLVSIAAEALRREQQPAFDEIGQ